MMCHYEYCRRDSYTGELFCPGRGWVNVCPAKERDAHADYESQDDDEDSDTNEEDAK